jgi:hypothetical protein
VAGCKEEPPKPEKLSLFLLLLSYGSLLLFLIAMVTVMALPSCALCVKGRSSGNNGKRENVWSAARFQKLE